MINDVQFYLYTVLGVIILSLAAGFFTKKYFIMPVATLIIMSVAAFVLPNFYNNLEWQPLLGYAVFLAVLSFVISVSLWVAKRNRRRAKELREAEQTIAESEDKNRK